MSDFAHIFNVTITAGDMALDAGALAVDDTLLTAVIHSWFTDARARPDDELPDPNGSMRGWWGDALPAETDGMADGDRYGSRIWLYLREKTTAEALAKVREAAAEALDWMVDIGAAAGVTVTTERVGLDIMGLRAVIEKPDGSVVEYQFNLVWNSGE